MFDTLQKYCLFYRLKIYVVFTIGLVTHYLLLITALLPQITVLLAVFAVHIKHVILAYMQDLKKILRITFYVELGSHCVILCF